MANDTFSIEDPYAPRHSRSGCMIMSIVAGIVIGLGVLAIGSCGGIVYFAMESMIGPQIVADLRDNPVMDEHIGTIASTDFIFGESFAAEEDSYTIDVIGSKGRGRLRVTAVEVGDTYDVVAGTLETPDGTEHNLFSDEHHHAE